MTNPTENLFVVIDTELSTMVEMGTMEKIKTFLDNSYPTQTIKDLFKIYALGQEYSYESIVKLQPKSKD